jgi:two-component system NtrC family sensor kinase
MPQRALSSIYAQFAFMQAEYAINVTDLAGHLLAVNDAYLKLYGFDSIDQVLGRNQRVIRSSRTPAEKYREMWEMIAQDKIWRGELFNRRTTGEDIPVHLSIYPIFEDGRKIGYMGFTFDRTQQVQLERQLLHSNRLAVLGEIGAGLAHELNNPLTSLSLEAENLLELVESNLNDQAAAQKSLKGILNGVDRMKRVIEHLLMYVRKEVKPAEHVELSEVLQDCLLFLERQFRSRNIQLLIDLPKGLWVRANRTDLESVFHNLLTNARDAFDQVVTEKTIRIHTQKCDDGWADLWVSDNAGGIPEEILPVIFEPFFTTKSDGNGTGLGLSISRKIILETGGEISCQSSDGHTHFRILLPLSSDPGPSALFLDEEDVVSSIK